MSSFTCQALAEKEPQTLGVTYWFDAAPNGAPYTVRVHISGRLREQPAAGQSETFTALATVDDVVPGSGRIAVTTRVPNLSHGTWDVTATPVEPAPEDLPADWMSVTDPRLPSGTAVGTTAFGPVVNVLAPGVRLGAWPALVGTGTALALVIQSLLASRLGLPIPRLLALSLVTCLLGLLGAKTYYLATHPRERRTFLTPGMSIQGFVLFAVATLFGGSLLLGFVAGAGARLDGARPAARHDGGALRLSAGRVLRGPPHQLTLGRLVLGPAPRCSPRPSAAVGVLTLRGRRRSRPRGGPPGRNQRRGSRLRRRDRRLHSRTAAALPAAGDPENDRPRADGHVGLRFARGTGGNCGAGHALTLVDAHFGPFRQLWDKLRQDF